MSVESSAGNSGDNLDSVVYGRTLNLLEEENNLLRKTLDQVREDLERLRRSPLMVCEVAVQKGGHAVIKLPNGNRFFVEVSLDCGKLKPGDVVLVEQKNLSVVKKLDVSRRFGIEKFVINERPDVQWSTVGGLAEQVREIKEIVELPLSSPELFQRIGIEAPRGVLLHGPPGTGKTMVAKAVATSARATFIEVVGSELVQKFIGEGAKMIKEIFRVAREKAPSIVFIDELDALASRRVDIGTSGEREVQRTFMQLLSEIDGFKGLGNVKVIGSTNRKDMLDPAILRPGRLERHIPFPLPTKDARREIFGIHSNLMRLGNIDVDVAGLTEGFTGAEIKSVCTEAGYFAIRDGRTAVENADFLSAIEKVKSKEETESREYVAMFG